MTGRFCSLFCTVSQQYIPPGAKLFRRAGTALEVALADRHAVEADVRQARRIQEGIGRDRRHGIAFIPLFDAPRHLVLPRPPRREGDEHGALPFQRKEHAVRREIAGVILRRREGLQAVTARKGARADLGERGGQRDILRTRTAKGELLHGGHALAQGDGAGIARKGECPRPHRAAGMGGLLPRRRARDGHVAHEPHKPFRGIGERLCLAHVAHIAREIVVPLIARDARRRRRQSAAHGSGLLRRSFRVDHGDAAAALEGVKGHLFQCAGEGEAGKPLAPRKGARAQSIDSRWEIGGGQYGAACERFRADGLERGRKRHLLQIGTALEGGAPDGGHAVAQDGGGEIRPRERPGGEGGNAGHHAQFIAEIARIGGFRLLPHERLPLGTVAKEGAVVKEGMGEVLHEGSPLPLAARQANALLPHRRRQCRRIRLAVDQMEVILTARKEGGEDDLAAAAEEVDRTIGIGVAEGGGIVPALLGGGRGIEGARIAKVKQLPPALGEGEVGIAVLPEHGYGGGGPGGIGGDLLLVFLQDGIHLLDAVFILPLRQKVRRLP